MGVPGLFRWLLKRFPAACWTSSKIELTRTQSLFVDLNSTLHHGARQSHGDFQAIATAVDELVGLIKPERLLFLAIDGVPPRMKERLQRERRERLATGPLTSSQSSFNSYSITPGTTWMRRVEAHLCEFIENKRRHDAKWRNLSVVLSGCQDPGEGEQKIMDYLRSQGRNSGRHCVWSNDADSVLLSLTTRVSNITMISERPKNGLSTYTIFDIDLLRDQIVDRYSSLLAEPSDTSSDDEAGSRNMTYKVDRLDSLIDDLVFMTLFAGNDFLPPVSFVMEWLAEPNFIDNLWAMYGHLPAKHQCLHDRGMINPRAFRELLKVFVTEGEERQFRKHIGVTALGSQLTALRIRRMEWGIQRKNIAAHMTMAGESYSAKEIVDDLAAMPIVGGGVGEHSAKRKKGRNTCNAKEPRSKVVRTRGTVPFVWCGPVLGLAGIRASTCNVALLPRSAPLAADAILGFLAPDSSQSASVLALDDCPLISPMMVSSFDLMVWLAGSDCNAEPVAALEVLGAIGSNKIKWLQSLAKILQLECTVRSSSDPKFESECKKWRVRRHQPGGGSRLRKEDDTMSATIVVGDLDVCSPTYIISLRTKTSASLLLRVSDICQTVAVVGEDDWDILNADARTERRRDAELAEWRQGFYRRHYQEKSPQFVQHMCTYYADALGWTAMYYFAGVVSSWEFAWPDKIEASHSGVAPLASDLLAFLDPEMKDWQYVPISDCLPPLAREHMLSVMPRDSWPLLLSDEEQRLAHLLHDNKYSDITRQEVHHCLANNVSDDGVPVVRVWF
ncbi:exonuclease II Exo2 [Coemansia sp. BCRC 34301]|nr:exonuclease II Exo2 [Coemansia sp. BCRC 34301]